MFKSSSPQTKSFVVILFLVLVGTGLVFWLYGKMGNSIQNVISKKEIQVTDKKQEQEVVSIAKAQEPQVDTSNWLVYKDSKYGISFKYDPEWNIKSWEKNKEGFDVLEIDPGQKYYNIKIYANPENFYVMDGLKTEEVTIGGTKAVSVSDMLYGVIKDQAHFTFDIGVSLSLKPKFNALVKTVSFN